MKRKNKQIQGRILIADDEQTFLEATAQLLRNEGFECDCAQDAQQALGKISKNTYNLLIADIKMPGNANLELVKELAEKCAGLSIILVTGYPSQQTAIEAINLPITAYLVKPVDFKELLDKTRPAVRMSRFHRTVIETKESLGQWIGELETIERTLRESKAQTFEPAVKSFIDITTMKIDSAFDAIRQITNLLDDDAKRLICDVIQCPALAELTKGLEQTITSLKESRKMYKSKQLGEIRGKLEKLLKKLQGN
ncbi:MAG: response regulator [Sedimentisphaerales bacterium]|nr:response regulator [Sedimentisphaerales bacterium]